MMINQHRQKYRYPFGIYHFFHFLLHRLFIAHKGNNIIQRNGMKDINRPANQSQNQTYNCNSFFHFRFLFFINAEIGKEHIVSFIVSKDAQHVNKIRQEKGISQNET